MDFKTAIVRFSAFSNLNSLDIEDLATLNGSQTSYARGDIIRSEGAPVQHVYLLHRGWTATSIFVGDAGRQLVKVHVPGDLLGTPSIAMTRAADSLIALTPALVSTVSIDALASLFASNPRLAFLIFLISQEERVLAMDRLATVGRTNSVGKLAALILELRKRVMRSESRDGASFDCPLSQEDVGDLVGMTNVHVSRTLKQLRDKKIADWSHGQITVYDEPSLLTLAGIGIRETVFNPGWLPNRCKNGAV